MNPFLVQLLLKAGKGVLNSTSGYIGIDSATDSKGHRVKAGSAGGDHDNEGGGDIKSRPDAGFKLLDLGDDIAEGSIFDGEINADLLDRIQKVVASDIDLKDVGVDPKNYIGALVKHGRKFGPNDVKAAFGALDMGIGDDPNDSENTLQGYAEHIFNYPYRYKEEAKELDPSIDTEQEHIGPMAQDIEAVNPACVVTDNATGYKSVDTSRLALMNAGAIGDLAREIFKLKEGA